MSAADAVRHGPRAAALRTAGALGSLALLECAAAAAILALVGSSPEPAIRCAAALAVAGAVRAAAGGSAIARQRALHRAALERFAPSARVLALAERAPSTIAAVGIALAAPLAAALGARSGGAATAIALGATIATAPIALRAVGDPIARWIAQMPAHELPDRDAASTAMELAVRSAAPALGLATIALGLVSLLAGESTTTTLARAAAGAAVAAPALIAAAVAARDAARARSELEEVARRIDAIDAIEGSLAIGASEALERKGAIAGSGAPAPRTLEPPHVPLASWAAREAWAAARSRIEEAAAELRSDAEARRQIEQEQQVRSRFMAAMGHELRSPLNSIAGFAQLLEDGSDGPLAPGQRESVIMVRRSAQDLLRLLTDILDSARLDAGRLRLKRAWTPSIEIVTEAVRLGRSVVEGQRVSLETSVQPGLPPVYVDRARVVQAVVATFRHAARGVRGDGAVLEVRASTGSAPSGVRSLMVEVRDPVHVLSPEELARIFDAFAELRDRASGRRIGGLGLALALARELARLHGGEVWAESAAPMGTRYVVAVPLEESRDANGGPRADGGGATLSQAPGRR